MWIFGLFFFVMFWKYEYNICPFFFFFHFSCSKFETPMRKFWSGKPVHKSCISIDDFFVQNSQTMSQQSIRIDSRKTFSWQKIPINSPQKKRRRTSPVNQKNIAPSLAHKKGRRRQTIPQMERIVQDWLQMANKGWRYSLL